MNKLVVFPVVFVTVLGIGAAMWIMTSRPAEAPAPEGAMETAGAPLAASSSTAISSPAFQPQTFRATKSAHFVSSEPANNAVLTTAPTSVHVSFNFDLTDGSKISVTRDGVDITTAPTTIAADALSMSVPVNVATTGRYVVSYTGCWPDRSCHDGSFGFSVRLTPERARF